MVVWICNPVENLPREDGRLMRYTMVSEILVHAGHQVVFWSGDFHHMSKTKRRVPSAYCHNGIDVRLIPTLPYYRNIGLQRVRSHLRFARDWQKLAVAHVADTQQKPNVIICSSPPISLFRAGERLAKRFNAKILLDVKDIWPETFYRVLPRFCRKMGPLFFLPLHWEIRRAYKRADGVSSVSDAYRAIITREDLKAFPLGVKLPKNLGERAPAQGQGLRLCYIGNLGSGYTLEEVFEGTEQLIKSGKAVSLTVAGDGPKRKLVEKYVALYPNIHYRGFVSGAELSTIMQNADVGILPAVASSGAVGANKIADYGGHGLAILNGLAGPPAKMLSDYGAGVTYQVDNPLSFIEAVNGMLDNPSWVDQMGRNARKMVEEQLDADKIYPAFARWIEEKSQN